MGRVLIIEDDADQREVLALFVREAGWEVTETPDGETGIKSAQSSPPDVIFCDLPMQGINGFQVCRTLRSDPVLKDTYIVVTSGHVLESDQAAAIEAGADEYLPKPVQLNSIQGLLKRMTKPTPTSPSAPGATLDRMSNDQTLVRFWGVRGSIPAPGPATVGFGGNTSCVEVRADGQLIILDAGTGLRALGQHLMEEFGDSALQLNLLLSHTHWDHIQGLPYFAPLYRSNAHLRVFGYEGARSSLSSVLTSQMESPFFPIGLKDVPSQLEIEELRDMKFDVGNVRVEACFANHPGICVGYRLNTSAGSVAFFPDNEPPRQRQPQDGQPDAQGKESSAQSEGEISRLVEFVKGVDMLIMDAQYTAEEYAQHVGWGHGCVDDVVPLALAAEVGRLFLFHHDPDHDDDIIRGMESRARQLVKDSGGRLHVEAAREGLQITLTRKG